MQHTETLMSELFCGHYKLTEAVKGLQTSDFRLQTSDFRLQTSDFRLQTSDFRLQTSDFRLSQTLVPSFANSQHCFCEAG